MLLALLACGRFAPPHPVVRDDSGTIVESTPPDDSGETGGPPAPPPLRIAWGDLHNHTNLSQDGCENADAGCLPDESLPGEPVFARAEANGLDFAAITDHAEFSRYQRDADGIDLDVWERTKELVAAAETGPVVPILGFEWTASCRYQEGEPEYEKVHRTVLLEDPGACAALRVPSCHTPGASVEAGAERYWYTDLDAVLLPNELEAALAAAGDLDGCAPTRWIAFYHHPAEEIPAWVDWADPDNDVPGDVVVEIASQHGSSECWDAGAEGCDWRHNTEHYVPEGSIQYALQLGKKLGFVGGTDNHEADPGNLERVGMVRNTQVGDTANSQFTKGTVTGVILPEALPLTRAALFDAIERRNTVAASWAFEGLSVEATGPDGARWLPGDDVPAAATPLTIAVTLDDPTVSSWTAELVAPDGTVAPADQLTLAPGDARYLRIRAFVGEEEHRVWASPWFGT